MSAEEDLIDYSDEELQTTTETPAANGAAPANGAAAAAQKGDEAATGGVAKYVGINSATFRDFLLKAELLKAITDCGFEHPSDGQFTP